MKWHRVHAIAVHTWYHLHHSVETWVDIFWFPLINMTMIASLALFFAGAGNPLQGRLMVVGLVLWFAIETGSYSIAVGALWEIWARSFSVLFISPLKLYEFIAGQIVFAVLKQCIILVLAGSIGYAISGFNVFSLGGTLAWVVFGLLVFGWIFGIFVLALVIRFGTRIQSLAWGLVYILQPLIGVYYPLSIFPEWVRRISYALPPTYLFDVVRAHITGKDVPSVLVPVILLTTCYAIGAVSFLWFSWKHAQESGALARMEG